MNSILELCKASGKKGRTHVASRLSAHPIWTACFWDCIPRMLYYSFLRTGFMVVNFPFIYFTMIFFSVNLTCRNSSKQRHSISLIFPAFSSFFWERISNFLVEARAYSRPFFWRSYRVVAWPIEVASNSLKFSFVARHTTANNILCWHMAWNPKADRGVIGNARAQEGRLSYNYPSLILCVRCHLLASLRDVIMVPLFEWYVTLWLCP